MEFTLNIETETDEKYKLIDQIISIMPLNHTEKYAYGDAFDKLIDQSPTKLKLILNMYKNGSRKQNTGYR
mgnify:CR=1 FL=1